MKVVKKRFNVKLKWWSREVEAIRDVESRVNTRRKGEGAEGLRRDMQKTTMKRKRKLKE